MAINPAPFNNLSELLLARLEATPDAPAFSYWEKKDPKKTSQKAQKAFDHGYQMKTLSWKDVGQRVRSLTAGLLSLGMKKGHRLLFYGPASVQTPFLELSVLALGGVPISLNPNLPIKELPRIISQCQVSYLFVPGQETWEKVLEIFHKLPDLQRVITAQPIRGDADVQLDILELEKRGLQGLKRAKMAGPKAKEGDLLKLAIQNVEKDRDAFLYFQEEEETPSHLIPLTHGQLLAQADQLYQSLAKELSEKDLSVSHLPLSKILARVEWLVHLLFGHHRFLLSEPLKDLQVFQKFSPTILFSHPDELEKIRQWILLELKDLSGIRGKLAKKSLQKPSEADQSLGGGIRGLLTDHLVLPKIKEKIGGKIKIIFSSEIKIPLDLLHFYSSLGITVREGYGLPQASGFITLTQGKDEKEETWGKPLPQCSIKISGSEEIQVKGPTVFNGYGLSSNELFPEGKKFFKEDWFFTSDLGEIDPNGNLKIKGSKKEMFTNAAGKLIFPTKIERLFLFHPLFHQIAILGENRPYLVALIVPNLDYLKGDPKWNFLSEEKEWVQNPQLKDLIKTEIATINQDLDHYEQIKDFAILSKPFSLKNGEITTSGKPKRKFLADTYQETVQSLYNLTL